MFCKPRFWKPNYRLRQSLANYIKDVMAWKHLRPHDWGFGRPYKPQFSSTLELLGVRRGINRSRRQTPITESTTNCETKATPMQMCFIIKTTSALYLCLVQNKWYSRPSQSIVKLQHTTVNRQIARGWVRIGWIQLALTGYLVVNPEAHCLSRIISGHWLL